MATKKWVGFPTSSFLQPISNPYNFTNALSKTVLLISDARFVSKHTAAYLDTTLHVSGFKVTKATSISSAPFLWTKGSDEESSSSDSKEEEEIAGDDAFWEYTLDLNEFDCILIPSQMNGDLWSALKDDIKQKLAMFVQNGGSLICCHFRATSLINHVCGVAWHEISVKIGVSMHCKRSSDSLRYVNDVRGIVNVGRDDIIYKTTDEITTVASRQCGQGSVYYIGHDFSAIWERSWNKILFDAIKKTLTTAEQKVLNLNFDKLNIDAFKSLQIIDTKDDANDEQKKSDIYLDEFQPDFASLPPSALSADIKAVVDEAKVNDDGTYNQSFAAFDELHDFDDNDAVPNAQQQTPQMMGYFQMDDDGVITLNDGTKFRVEVEANDGDEILDVKYNTHKARNLTVIDDVEEEENHPDDVMEEVD
mmetsp:Transcript_48939/g.81264  ORF Transcript_48939/g.81264 Transcript_48939/m.81264 type:complete len:420 (+) Transcript_48939:36-1295(+)